MDIFIIVQSSFMYIIWKDVTKHSTTYEHYSTLYEIIKLLCV